MPHFWTDTLTVAIFNRRLYHLELVAFGGSDETRTRDLRRDRPSSHLIVSTTCLDSSVISVQIDPFRSILIPENQEQNQSRHLFAFTYGRFTTRYVSIGLRVTWCQGFKQVARSCGVGPPLGWILTRCVWVTTAVEKRLTE